MWPLRLLSKTIRSPTSWGETKRRADRRDSTRGAKAGGAAACFTPLGGGRGVAGACFPPIGRARVRSRFITPPQRARRHNAGRGPEARTSRAEGSLSPDGNDGIHLSWVSSSSPMGPTGHRALALLSFVIAAITVAAAFAATRPNVPSAATDEPPPPSPPPSPEPSACPKSAGLCTERNVTRVVDGDTLDVEGNL